MKRLLAAQAGKGSPGGSAGYTANVAAELKQRCSVRSPRDWLDPAVQSAAFRCRTAPTSRCCNALHLTSTIWAFRLIRAGSGQAHVLLLGSCNGLLSKLSDQSAYSTAEPPQLVLHRLSILCGDCAGIEPQGCV